MRVRVLVHALDRTGPPVLALSHLAWLAEHHPEVEVDVVAFRGGALADDAGAFGPVTVLLHPHEPWDAADPDPRRAAELRDLLAGLPEADRVLLVSVAAGQCLPYLADRAPVVTWCVEQGEDLHWLDAPIGLRERTAAWLAGSTGSMLELRERLAPGTEVALVPEFVAAPPSADARRDAVADVRRQVSVDGDVLLVVGAGIATYRKAPDLFLEVALAVLRSGRGPVRFAWIGGVDDELHPLVAEEARRLGIADHLALVPPVPDVVPWLAAADVVVHPARLDAFPLVCLHASAVGTPVVAFAGAGGVEEMFEASFLGVPYPDVAGLAALVDDLRDPQRRSAAGVRQQAVVQRRWLAEVGAPVLHAHVVGAGS